MGRASIWVRYKHDYKIGGPKQIMKIELTPLDPDARAFTIKDLEVVLAQLRELGAKDDDVPTARVRLNGSIFLIRYEGK